MNKKIQDKVKLKEEKRPSSYWNILYTIITGRLIGDPDGWDRKNFDEGWSEPITWGEFNTMAMRSTIRTGSDLQAKMRIFDQALKQNTLETLESMREEVLSANMLDMSKSEMAEYLLDYLEQLKSNLK